MDRSVRKSSFMRMHETYCRAGKWVNEDRGKKLSKEFLRKPYGLQIKENENG